MTRLSGMQAVYFVSDWNGDYCPGAAVKPFLFFICECLYCILANWYQLIPEPTDTRTNWYQKKADGTCKNFLVSGPIFSAIWPNLPRTIPVATNILRKTSLHPCLLLADLHLWPAARLKVIRLCTICVGLGAFSQVHIQICCVSFSGEVYRFFFSFLNYVHNAMPCVCNVSAHCV